MTTRRPARTNASKQKLFDAAIRLLGAHGPDGVTVEQIAEEAGVAKGTVYYNFGSKDGLVEALLRYGIELLEERLRTASEQQEVANALDALVDSALAFLGDYSAFAQLLVGELWRTSGNWRETLAPLRERIVSIIADTLRRAADAGRLPEKVEVPAASAALFGTLIVVALDWRVFHPERERAEVRDSVLTLVHGLVP